MNRWLGEHGFTHWGNTDAPTRGTPWDRLDNFWREEIATRRVR
jgi:hypothetical protein